MGNNLEPITEQTYIARLKERLTQHPIFSTNDVVTREIIVKDIPLYYQPQYSQFTFATLSQQYKKITGRDLILTDKDVQICPEDSIVNIVKNTELEQKVGEVLQKLQDSLPISTAQTKLQSEYNNRLIESIFKKSEYFHRHKVIQGGNPNTNAIISPYNCKLNINWNGGTVFLIDSIKVNQKTTFTQIIGYSRNKLITRLKAVIQDRFALENMLQQLTSDLQLQNIELQDSNYQIISSQRYPQPIHQIQTMKDHLDQRHSSFRLNFYGGSCFFSTTSFIRTTETNLPIQKFIDLHQKKPFQILAFNKENKKLVQQKNPVVNFSFRRCLKNDNFVMLRIFTEEEESKVLAVFKKTMLLSVHNEWIHAQNLKKNMIVLGVSKRDLLMQIKIMEVLEQKPTQKQISVVAITSPQFHNLIIDNLIVHNRNTISIDCNLITESHRQKFIQKVYHDEIIENHFKGKRCYFAGKMIQPGDTFGDFRIKDNGILYIFDNQKVSHQQIIFSLPNTKHFCFHPTKFKQDFLQEFRQNYLGVSNSGIYSFQRGLNNLQKQKKLTHIVIDNRGCAERSNYYLQIQPEYKQFEDDLYPQYSKNSSDNQNIKLYMKQFQSDYKFYKDGFEGQPPLNLHSFFSIHLYTSNCIYRDLNLFLRKNYGKRFNAEQYKKWITVTGCIIKSLAELPNYDDICYRGMQNISLREYLGLNYNNESVFLPAFVSASTNKNTAFQRFSSENGILLTIRSRTGKNITCYSQFKKETQILLQAFSHYAILEYDEKSKPQTATLQQIPLPRSNSDKLIFWVDDQPLHNEWMVKELRGKGIEVVQVTSTKIMNIIIKKFFWIYKVLGKTVLIVTDMGRDQNGVFNQYAGADLLNLIYNIYGLSVITYIYVGKIEECKAKLRQRQISFGKYRIECKPKQLINKILAEFSLS